MCQGKQVLCNADEFWSENGAAGDESCIKDSTYTHQPCAMTGHLRLFSPPLVAARPIWTEVSTAPAYCQSSHVSYGMIAAETGFQKLHFWKESSLDRVIPSRSPIWVNRNSLRCQKVLRLSRKCGILGSLARLPAAWLHSATGTPVRATCRCLRRSNRGMGTLNALQDLFGPRSGALAGEGRHP